MKQGTGTLSVFPTTHVAAPMWQGTASGSPTRPGNDQSKDRVQGQQNSVEYCIKRLRAAEAALLDVRESLVNLGVPQRQELAQPVLPSDAVVVPMGQSVQDKMATGPSASQDKLATGAAAPSSDDLNASRDQQMSHDTQAPAKKALTIETQGTSSVTSMTTKMLRRLRDHSDKHKAEIQQRFGGVDALAEKYHIHPEAVEKCRRAFAACDVAENGKVSANELYVLMEEACGMKFTGQEITQILEKFDKDQDGDLNFEEFLGLYCETPLYRVTDLDNHISRVGQEIRQQMEGERLSPDERAQEIGVSSKAVTGYLRKELSEAGACMQLPVAGLLLILFTSSVFMHMRLEELHAVDRAITWDLNENANFAFGGSIPFDNGRMGHKNIDDVNSIADFWSWFNLGITPLFWPEGWDISEVRMNTAARCMHPQYALEYFGWDSKLLENMTENPKDSWTWDYCPEGHDQPPGEWGDVNHSNYLYYYTILGGLRMRQESVMPRPCLEFDLELKNALNIKDCLDRESAYWLAPELRNAIGRDHEGMNLPGAETQILLSRSSQSEIRRQLRDLENKAWLNFRTSKVELMFTTYNAHMDVLTATYIFFFLNRGGHIHKIVEPLSVWLHPYHGWWNYVIDISWALLVLCLLVFETWEVSRYVRQLGCRRTLTLYVNLSNIVDWLSIVTSFIVAYCWFLHLSKLEQVRVLMRRADVAVLGSWSDEQDRKEFFDAVADIMSLTVHLRGLLAFYPFVIISRLFKAYAYQPRLALVTTTMNRASIEFIHFAVVFSSIFVIYTIAGMILFGQEILHFANFGRAIATTFRILMGEVDWEEMTRVGRFRANAWFWTFMLLLQFTMLNMLLAIVMDVYTEVKGSMGKDAETLWSQACEIYTRMRAVQAGKELRFKHILRALDPTDLDDEDEDAPFSLEFYTVSTLCEAVPNLPEEQARSILVAAQEMHEAKSRRSTSLTETALTVQRMASILWKLHQAVQQLFHMAEMHARLIVNASETAGRMGVARTEQKEEKKSTSQDASSKPADASPYIERLALVLSDFQQQHRQTDSLLSRYEAQLSRSASQTAAREAPELRLPDPPDDRLRKNPNLFPGICTSPRLAASRKGRVNEAAASDG